MYTTNPDKFAKDFVKTVPGAYRQINAQDIRDMTNCGLIGRYGSYGSTDIQMVIGILQYEQLFKRRKEKVIQQIQEQLHHCRLCGELLLPQPYGKKGRPREYCDDCEASRSKNRNRKWRDRKRKVKRAPLVKRC